MQDMRMTPRQILCAAALALLAAAPVHAQEVDANMAIPFYNTAHAVQGLYGQWFAPQAKAAQASAQALNQALRAHCTAPAGSAAATLQTARQAYVQSSRQWSSLSAVALGPLVERRSARLVDFRPMRPALLKKAIQSAPADLAAMERIGAPAKGYPALENLLWTQPVEPQTPACAYATLVAEEIGAEMGILSNGFAKLAAQDWSEDGDATTEAMAEFINQWVGGLERLRWADMEKPLRSAGSKPPAWEHLASGSTVEIWRAHWQSLRTLAVSVDRKVPQPGVDIVPIESYLRGRGLNPLADRWLKAVNEADAGMRALTEPSAKAVDAATKPLSRLKRLMEGEVAPALEVNIGFSDADGD
ncbi:imelysin family protein [Delftia sp. RIT313]|uniref:imelysin family protein n=1 Tax=Delftia sp. RIT313 TaxID=1468410 RepID=UPI00044A6FEB|nr:imelysin family protein [Delftia sp. RIT313]EZP48604.1 Periplasmic lipoprotein-like protein [Delftia sp. RIT313]